ncbi:MAG: hypothetical protein HQ518_00650 [Rhodopirellula sp.]|nr:hypothetical protein [Rhodopirellula sp.]
MHRSHYTVGDTARLFGVQLWRIRRVVDALDDQLPRAGQYRLIPADLLPVVAERLEERGWLTTQKNGGRR